MRIIEIFLNCGVWKSDCAVDALLAFEFFFCGWQFFRVFLFGWVGFVFFKRELQLDKAVLCILKI